MDEWSAALRVSEQQVAITRAVPVVVVIVIVLMADPPTRVNIIVAQAGQTKRREQGRAFVDRDHQTPTRRQPDGDPAWLWFVVCGVWFVVLEFGVWCLGLSLCMCMWTCVCVMVLS